jgi:hypothetical protein
VKKTLRTGHLDRVRGPRGTVGLGIVGPVGPLRYPQRVLAFLKILVAKGLVAVVSVLLAAVECVCPVGAVGFSQKIPRIWRPPTGSYWYRAKNSLQL